MIPDKSLKLKEKCFSQLIGVIFIIEITIKLSTVQLPTLVVETFFQPFFNNILEKVKSTRRGEITRC